MDHCKLLFEVSDLQTRRRRRCLDAAWCTWTQNLNYEPYIWTWCNKREDQEQAEVLRAMFDKYMDKSSISCSRASTGISRQAAAQTIADEPNLVRQCCNMLDCL